MTTRTASGERVWICGQRSLRVQIIDEAKPYNPVSTMWMDSDTGQIIGMNSRHPDMELSEVAEDLYKTLVQTIDEATDRPTRIRTASGMLAEVLAMSLAESHPDVEIVVAPTPELKEAFDSLDASLNGEADLPTHPEHDDAPAAEPAKPANDVYGGAERDRATSASESSDTKHLLELLRQLQNEAREAPLDVQAVQDATEALFKVYVGSPEAAAFDQPLHGPEIIGQIAALHHGRTILALGEGHLDDVLFETLPSRVAAGPEIARPIIDTMRTFYIWLKREHAVFEADDMLELLGDDAVQELEDCMSDPELAGPVKSMIMDAEKAGVDLSDKRAIDAFMRSKVGTRLPDDMPGGASPFGFPYGDDFDNMHAPSQPPLTPAQQRSQQQKRKKDRKSARKARKKNR